MQDPRHYSASPGGAGLDHFTLSRVSSLSSLGKVSDTQEPGPVSPILDERDRNKEGITRTDGTSEPCREVCIQHPTQFHFLHPRNTATQPAPTVEPPTQHRDEHVPTGRGLGGHSCEGEQPLNPPGNWIGVDNNYGQGRNPSLHIEGSKHHHNNRVLNFPTTGLHQVQAVQTIHVEDSGYYGQQETDKTSKWRKIWRAITCRSF